MSIISEDIFRVILIALKNKGSSSKRSWEIAFTPGALLSLRYLKKRRPSWFRMTHIKKLHATFYKSIIFQSISKTLVHGYLSWHPQTASLKQQLLQAALIWFSNISHSSSQVMHLSSHTICMCWSPKVFVWCNVSSKHFFEIMNVLLQHYKTSPERPIKCSSKVIFGNGGAKLWCDLLVIFNRQNWGLLCYANSINLKHVN